MTGIYNIGFVTYFLSYRYNVIVKGIGRTKITPGMAFGLIILLWGYSVGNALLSFLFYS